MSRVTDWMKTLWERSMLHRAMLVAPPVALLLLVGSTVIVGYGNYLGVAR